MNNNPNKPLTLDRAQRVVRLHLRTRTPFVVSGSPGCGKSEGTAQEAAAITAPELGLYGPNDGLDGLDVIFIHLVAAEATDLRGLPIYRQADDQLEWRPHGDLLRIITAERPTLVLFEDLGTASESVQAALMQLWQSRRLDCYEVPACVAFGATTNGTADGAGSAGVNAALQNRAAIVSVKADARTWLRWAGTNGIHPALLAFCEHSPRWWELPWDGSVDLISRPTPRSLTKIHNVLRDAETYPLTQSDERDVVASLVGDECAREWVAFRAVWERYADIGHLLANPDAASIPTDPGAAWALVVRLAQEVARDHSQASVSAVATLLNRIGSDYAVFAWSLIAAEAARATAKGRPAWTESSREAQQAFARLGNLLFGGAA